MNSQRFSDRSILAGGGHFTLQFSDIEAAAKVLRQYYGSIDFWQVSKRFTVRRDKHYFPTTGFSQPYYPQGYTRPDGKRFPATSSRQIVPALKRAINDAAVNAINQQGYRFAYGKTPPQNVKEAKGHKGVFQLIIWFHGNDARTFFPEE